MFDVKTVIDGTWEPKTLIDAMEGFCVLQNLQEEVNKGRDNAWGFIFTIGRNTYAEYFQKKDGLNDANVPWYQMAAQQFQMDTEKAILLGETRGFSARGINNFKNATATIQKAMMNGADLLERDVASGAFVLGSKNKVEKWNKDFDEKAKVAKQEAIRAEMVRKGQLPALVAGTENLPVTPAPELQAELEGLDPELQEFLSQYISTIVSMSKQEKLVANKDGKEETGLTKAKRLIQGDLARMQGIFIHDFANLKKAANG